MSKSDGGPAFPHVWVDDGRPAVIAAGMTLRDYFAAAAMQGWLASFLGESRHPVVAGNDKHVAQLSYEMADAMLKEREK